MRAPEDYSTKNSESVSARKPNYVIHLIENKEDLEQEATEIYKELARKTDHLNEIKKNGK